MGLLQEFKTFALKGNVVDMAVGVIMGGAFGKNTYADVNNVVINATKSILTMVQDLADTGDLSFPKQVAAVAELKDNMQTSAFVLPKSVYAEVESFAVNYPQKGYNIVLNALRELVSNGATSLDVAALEAMHAELLKAMPVDETQDQLNALIRNLQDYCNVLDD